MEFVDVRKIIGRRGALHGDSLGSRSLEAWCPGPWLRLPALPPSKSLTDFHFLALAVKHGGRFATLDANINAALVPGGPAAYYLIPT